MKKIQLSLMAMLLLGAVACVKNNSSIRTNGNVSNGEAADMVSASISGVANLSNDATFNANVIANSHPVCGTIRSDTVSHQSATGSPSTYSYMSTYNFVVNCVSNMPDNLSSNLVYNNSFSNQNISSTNSGSSAFTVTGLQPTATSFVINGEYKRNGAFTSKIDTSNHGTNNVDIVINGLTITRSSRIIASGTATTSVTGYVPKKGNFSYTGTLVFNGDGTATLTLNGTVYIINLVTGQRTKQ